ncbi:MAG: glucose-1-phosphate adenylyltransferase, partial [Thermodesulfobacteriota bacterium]|nr:glucose-1-phosphate adenylyltransferase [Thermodesulfobacteriota bacterium]
VRVDSCATVEESILLEGVRIGEDARVKRTIIDKHSQIPPGMEIGYNLEEDAKRFTVTKSGLVVVPKGFRAQ